MRASFIRLILAFYTLDYSSEPYAHGHGRLMEPPSRSSLWRFKEFDKYSPIKNYDDNELFCGGFKVQYGKNNGRCGPCGDPYNATVPRDNESGGMYALGIVTRDYRVGQVMDVGVQLTRSHKGYFQFRICQQENPSIPETQSCFNRNLLQLADGSGTKFPIYTAKPLQEYFNASLRLPAGLSCPHCVLQWHYRTGNSWGNCTDGKQALGCGNQEVFRGCADISIH